MKFLITMLLIIAFPLTALAAELSKESLVGKWMFTHIILEDGNEMPVNRLMEFKSDGKVANYKRTGELDVPASFEVKGETILYTDKRGAQKWKVKVFDKDSLHVDHRGAKMFLKRE